MEGISTPLKTTAWEAKLHGDVTLLGITKRNIKRGTVETYHVGSTLIVPLL